jgi:restriction system protein
MVGKVSIKKGPSDNSFEGQKKTRTKLAKGLRTKSDDFEIPILLALDSLGGSGNIHDVFNIVEKLMINDLTKSDWQPLPSNPKSLRWKNSVQWARLHLVKEGFLSNTSTKGIWEITESGRTALKDDKKKEK